MADPAASELDELREHYKSSLSWRLNGPLRAAKRRVRALRPSANGAAPAGAGEPPLPGLGSGYDSWLEDLFGERLGALDAACADGDLAHLARFRDLPTDLWALLLTKEYEAYPNIRALLPDLPDPALQTIWNGATGVKLAAQSAAFYSLVRERYAKHGTRPLTESRVLDFGCGWGRLTRLFARDVDARALCGCDPVESVLEVCRATRVPATLARSQFVPDGPPFDEPFDLAYSFSVFTHISEAARGACLKALHAGLAAGGLLVLTIRPPDYLRRSPLMHDALRALGPDPRARLREPRYMFVPHPVEGDHPQHEGSEMTYGETTITLPYVRKHCTELYELVAVNLLLGDLHQVAVTLRRRQAR